jgi:hypothetical protein
MSLASYRIHLSPSAVFQELTGEAVLLDLSREMYFGLDAVGSALWQALQQSDDLGRALDVLSTKFAVERPRLEQDVLDFLRELDARALIEITPALPASLSAADADNSSSP